METNLEFLNIFPNAIDSAISKAENALKQCGFEEDYVFSLSDLAFNELKYSGDITDITNSIIFAYFFTAKSLIEQHTGKSVDYVVDGITSTLTIDGEDVEA